MESRLALTLLGFAAMATAAPAQISITTAVDLALRSNPRVLAAQADVDKARAQLQETHDVYIPSLSAGAGLGQAYGYSEYPPTLATLSSTSLVYNAGQHAFVRSARAGLRAAELSLEDMREQVAEDTASAFLTLDHDQQREHVIDQKAGYANNLVTVVQDRADAGQDTQIDLTQAKLAAAQLRSDRLKAGDDIAYDREHLARLIGLPPASLSADGEFPAAPLPSGQPAAASGGYANFAVASAFANADAKFEQARGDSRFRFWPSIYMQALYNRYATFTNSFKTLNGLYNDHLTANEGVFGVQIQLPLFDKARQDRGRESSEAAARARQDAQEAQIDALDGQARLRHSASELQAQADVAALQQQLAQLKLQAIRLQLQSGNPNGPQLTPKDELSARITERDDYLAVVDAGFQLRQSEIQLLRQRGQLIDWLKSAASSPQTNLPAMPSPQP
ncbi:MAG: TolC family protein [Acidobacteriaceae bacterium]|jgi:outer membrane protein TolC